jgi:DNA-binding response OmpR family regulator
MLLAEAGYIAVTARSVPTAMQILTAEPPDLLIVDVRLEGYNGLHLIAMAPTPIPAIVVTGFADSVLEADARRLGADYLRKPISPSTLYALVAQRLSPTGMPDRSCRPDDGREKL